MLVAISSLSEIKKDDEDNEIVNVDFDFFNIDEIDYHAVKHLLVQLFHSDSQDLELHTLTDLILSQSGVGTTIKVDGKESDPYAFLTAVNLNSNNSIGCVSNLSNYLLNRAKSASNQSLYNTLNQLLSGESSSQVGLLLEELESASKSGQAYNFTHYLIPARTYIESDNDVEMDDQGPTKKQRGGNNSKLQTFHPEDDITQDFTELVADYQYKNVVTREQDAFGADIRGRLILIEAEKLKNLQPKPAQYSQKKPKRKSQTDASPDSSAVDQQTGQPIKKRQRTARSCDSCRSRKIRCDFLPDEDPPCCKHCKHNGLPCTSNLPISETRFKKRSSSAYAPETTPILQAQPQPQSQSQSQPQPQPPPLQPPSQPQPQPQLQPQPQPQSQPPQRLPQPQPLRQLSVPMDVPPSGVNISVPSAPPPPSGFPIRLPPMWAQLPTSVERNLKDVDDRYHQKSSLTPNGDDEETKQMLLDIYFSEIAPIFPVLTTATGRQVPLETLNICRSALNDSLAGSTLSRSSLVTIQALLICSLNTDAHSTALGSSGSSIWLRSGAAIRMAHDLGLHKESNECTQWESNRRRRVWAAVVIMDRWASCAHGLPMTINLVDCDVLLPSPFEFYKDEQSEDVKPIIKEDENKPYSFFVEMVKNSVLLGRILQTLYSAVGLRLVTDEQLFSLAADIEHWREDLPNNLKFTGSSSSPQAGVLQMAYVTLCLLLFRPMMRASENEMSDELKHTLDETRWNKVYIASTECIDWVYQNQKIMDQLQDERALDSLHKVVEILEQWQRGGGGDDAITWRNKLTDIIHILNKSATRAKSGTQSVSEPDGSRMRRNTSQLRYSEDKRSDSSGGFNQNQSTFTGVVESQQQQPPYAAGAQNGVMSYAALSTNRDDLESVQSPFQIGQTPSYPNQPIYSSVIDDSTPHHAFFDLNAWDVLMQNFHPVGSSGGGNATTPNHGVADVHPPQNTQNSATNAIPNVTYGHIKPSFNNL
ncbi:hypothetical protein E3Q19_01767 [Wallemia mellicola]|uniref:Zn(2)-C6 fungal-type domain-containing protein n=1 Tax=Wallemia mellicola TaxID=1708541 RepID=A0AB74KG49_9BASI|nr:hypothetical protein E3Q24_01459 [Wallemia mellicola]TIB92865.1 hypothetical protein E3Q19_01767 [Wallemia mellicola]TIC68857.1 hypothetical protein E3Q03_01475 [Wallemia mellicola]